MRTTDDIKQRIEEGVVRDQRGCWIWKGGTAGGYPICELNGKRVTLRRMAYAIYNRPPGNRVIRCRCRKKLCLNPKHLFLLCKNKGGRPLGGKG